MTSFLAHHGILGMKWGIRRYQNPDGSLTPAGERRRDKKDAKWVDRHADRIYKKVSRRSKRELKRVSKRLNRKYVIPTSAKYRNEYNSAMAEIMNSHLDKIPSAPSGKVIRFIAKRGELGVHMALADPDYDLSQVKNGVYSSGRIAYKKKEVGRM